VGITNRPGLGVGRRLLAALEERGRTGGAHTIRLETNRALVEAIALYRSTGYQEVEALTRSRTPTTGSQVALTGQGVERGQLLAPFRGVVARASRFEGRGEVWRVSHVGVSIGPTRQRWRGAAGGQR
jgi:hypothetical protein